jgi:hypothetical protein
MVRAHFRLRLAELDERIFRHHLQGIELRALFYACCNESEGNTGWKSTWIASGRRSEEEVFQSISWRGFGNE